MYSSASRAPVINPAYDAVAPFADPFADLAATAMPLSVPAMLRHAEFFSVADETLRAAYNRVASYFLTDIQVTGELGDDAKKDQREYLVDEAGVIQFCHDAGISFLTYGNHYTSVLHPIVRYVVCPARLASGRVCGARWRFAEFNTNPVFHYRWAAGVHGSCPACGYTGMFHDRDRPPVDEPDPGRPIILRSWNPHDIRIVWNEATGQAAAFDWVIPADVRTDARQGYNKPFLEDTPWEWLMAAMADQNIRFTADQVHHWREPYLAGLRFRGVGVPRAIINYRQLYYTRILRRMNEVLALGHVVPMRVISPANTAGRADEGDILKVGHMGGLKTRVNQMIANFRADPSSIQFAPIPLQFQALGADARQLIPADVLNQGQEVLLNGADMPVEFYRLSMAAQNAPVGLRLLESVWAPYVRGLNTLLGFIGGRARFLLKWEKARYAFERVTLIDSIEKSQLRVQMAQAGLSSRTKALREVDMDFEEETRQKLLDQRLEQRLQSEFEEENESFGFSRQLAQAQAPPGGAPAGQPGQPGQPDPAAAGGAAQPGGPQQAAGTPPGSDPLASLLPQPGTQMDPSEYLGRARQVAQYLITMPEGQRFGVLQQIRSANSMFHQLVKGQLDDLRSQARSRGQQMVLGQMGAAQ